ncbi:MAG TPA: HD domain-containing protein [Rectinema sp.]|nr:HD domain-containing protein [Rectinema sp.]HRU78213.1 HD domain-containing protein [Rectinema sp.]
MKDFDWQFVEFILQVPYFYCRKALYKKRFIVNNPLPNDVYVSRKRSKESDVRGDYYRDQTAIIHSMPFRRLKHKTQVFFSPDNDHVCTRIEHVMHVATIATTICKGLEKAGWELNEELAGAIGLGHDLGHAPFGHAGEEAISMKLGKKDAFMHEINSYRVVEYLANNGNGLNLTYAVKDGIICHNGEEFEKQLEPRKQQVHLDDIKDKSYFPCTYEGCIVRLSDKIAYLGRDIEDAIISGLIKKSDIPEDIVRFLGDTNGEIINTLVLDVIETSIKENKIALSDDKYDLVNELKEFNYKRIYSHERIEEYKTMCENGIMRLFEYLTELYCKFGKDFRKYRNSKMKLDQAFGKYIEKMNEFYMREENIPNQIITDYIGGMTDNFALECLYQITIPRPLEY